MIHNPNAWDRLLDNTRCQGSRVVAGSRSEAYGATAVLMSREDATINMVIAALGGEGGGVLTNWLIAAAEQSGWWCQSTSLAGVAQRTGATIYYLEFMPRQGIHQPRSCRCFLRREIST